MGTRLAPVRRDSTDELHPRIYAALIGLTILLVPRCGCCSAEAVM
jgi:hypothetical protein